VLLGLERWKDNSMNSDDIERHKGLVVMIAKKYKGHGADFDDLVQEGMIGLMSALKKYNPEKGVFTTYATLWIKQRIIRHIENYSRNVRLPVWAGHARFQAARYVECQRKLTGCIPSLEDIVDNVKVDISKKYIKSVVSVRFIESSMDDLIDNSRVLHDVIGCDGKQLDFEPYEIIHIAMGRLCKRYQVVLRMRYFEDMTLQDVGNHFGVSRERVRQIQGEALLEMKKIIRDME